MDKLTILFPSDYFDKSRVDDDLKKEYDSVLKTGLFNVLLFSYDDWFNNKTISLNITPEGYTKAIYRGWMMTPERYEQFIDSLKSKNIHLITKADEYKLMHAFPNIYPMVSEDTAQMLVFPEGEHVDINVIGEHFSRFMIKDYVKSVKGSQFPKFFTNNISQEELDNQLELFRKFRGDLFTGGICIKEYVDLKHYGNDTNEYRVYYVRGHIVSICRNSLQQPFTPEPPNEIITKYRNLSSPFYTVDYAEKEDGSWVIIEAGDGQVSGLSEGQDYDAFYRALYQAMTIEANDNYCLLYDSDAELYGVHNIDGSFFGYYNPTERIELKHDPVEETDEYKAVVDEVDRLAQEKVDEVVRKLEEEWPSFGIQIPTGHRFAYEKKKILKEKYGIEWKSVIEMNPEVTFD